jgi:hypothetical protein
MALAEASQQQLGSLGFFGCRKTLLELLQSGDRSGDAPVVFRGKLRKARAVHPRRLNCYIRSRGLQSDARFVK